MNGKSDQVTKSKQVDAANIKEATKIKTETIHTGNWIKSLQVEHTTQIGHKTVINYVESTQMAIKTVQVKEIFKDVTKSKTEKGNCQDS